MKNLLKNKTGIALVFVLWVLTLLSVIAGEFCYTTRTEVNITRNFKEETQAYYIAQAGVYAAIAELIKKEIAPQTLKSDDSDAINKVIPWRINADNPVVPFGEGSFKVHIDNESGKINLNQADENMLKMMLSRFNLNDKDNGIIVDSILDWRDADTLHRLNGAEDDYYQSLPKPYDCKDADFDTIEELLLVKGMKPELFYGGLNKIVTVYQDVELRKTDKPKATGQYLDKININAASPQLLYSLPMMSQDLVKSIIEFRRKKDIESPAEMISLIKPEILDAIMPYVTSQYSPFYTITSIGSLEGSAINRGVQAFVKIDLSQKKKYRMIQWRDNNLLSRQN